MTGLEMGLMGASLAPTLFGTGGSVKVPGAMARPTDPTSTFVDTKTGMLRDAFKQSTIETPEIDKARGLIGGLEAQAIGQGPTKAGESSMVAARQASEQAQEAAQRQAASSQATQAANLAMKGGLGSGSRARLAESAQQGLLGNQNALNQQLAGTMANITAQDEARKLGMQRDAIGDYKGLGQFEFGRQLADRQGGMGLTMDKYKADMNAWAANEAARAQAQAANAKSKGLLGGLF